LQEGGQAFFHHGAVQIAQDEDKAGLPIMPCRPSGQALGRVKHVLHTMQHDRPILPLQVQDRF
jgi:hypothetical protein